MRIGYIALCLVVPLLWGLASARLFDWWQARRIPSVSSPPGNDVGAANTSDEDETRASGHMYHI